MKTYYIPVERFYKLIRATIGIVTAASFHDETFVSILYKSRLQLTTYE